MRPMRNLPTPRRHWGVALAGLVIALLVTVLAMAPSAPAAAQSETPTATPAPFIFEDNDPALEYEGIGWNTVNDPKARGGTLHQARASGHAMRLRFRGPYFKWYAVRGPNRGFARVSVDGVEVGNPIDLYRAGEPGYELIVWQGGLNGDSDHILLIEVMGRRSGASADSLVDVDWIEVVSAERAPITPTPTVTASPAMSPTPTVTPTPQISPTPTPGADKPPGSWPIDSRFLRFYVERDGLRILGNTISPPTFYAGHFAQYFEKGRLEDHTGESPDPNWQFLYGLLVDEMQLARVPLPVGGEQSTVNYTVINQLAQEAVRVPAPAGFTGGNVTNSDGSVFVPYSQSLRPGPGHNISPIFWPYINRTDIFPGGWLHDIGLPMTEAVPAVVTKGNLANRQIMVQVFQRTILTYDPLNPPEFQVERANVGTDYRRAFPDRVPQT